MGVYAKYGTIAVGAYMAHQPGSHPRAFTDQYTPRWDRGGARSPKTWRDKARFVALWPRGSFGMCGADASTPYQPAGLDPSGFLGYEPYSCDGEGTQTKRFIRGVTNDADGNPLSGVIVQGFVTATDAYVGEVQSMTDGTYILGTETVAGTAHYLVAFLAGSPNRAAASDNTILSTNVDGS